MLTQHLAEVRTSVRWSLSSLYTTELSVCKEREALAGSDAEVLVAEGFDADGSSAFVSDKLETSYNVPEYG